MANPKLIEDLRLFGRILLFRATSEDLRAPSWRLLVLALLSTWLVGVGRWWDDPRPTIPDFVRAGLGSVVYVFALSLLLWLACLPFTRQRTSYRAFLTFVACTSPPAALYALPIEMWVSLDAAKNYNLAALMVVATYRVALLFWFLRRGTQLRPGEALLAGITPILVIVASLLILGFAARVFDIMGGLRTDNPSESAEAVMFLLGLISLPLGGLALLAYLFAAGNRILERIGHRTKPTLHGERLRWRHYLKHIEIDINKIQELYGSNRNGEFRLYFHLENHRVVPLSSEATEFWGFASELEHQLSLKKEVTREASEKDRINHPVLLYSKN